MSTIVAYVPVLHRGYLDFFNRHRNANAIYLLDRGFCIQEQSKLEKDIRSLDAAEVALALSALGYPLTMFSIINSPEFLSSIGDNVIMPNEDISKIIAAKYLVDPVEYDNTFLRWDNTRIKAEQEVVEHFALSQDDFSNHIMALCYKQAEQSADWWRQVGACIVKDGEVILRAHNQHVPSANQPYFDGDSRSESKKGIDIHLSTAFHAELSLIVEAAKEGIGLDRGHLYVTTFPCPWCAKAIAYSGISRVYFADGYSVLDAESILTANNIEIYRVVK
ncbi:MAG: deaminase [bacterium]